MIKIENTIVTGWEAAIRGARMPLQSFAKSDSRYEDGHYVIGENDLDLLSRLSTAGNDHGKFMRMIHVQCDITCPVYFAAELDTYKVGTTRNSSSLQHKGMSRDYTIDDFSTDIDGGEIAKWTKDYWERIIDGINDFRRKYVETKDYDYFRVMRQLMPMGYNYTFTWDANYAVLKNIYYARKGHRLSEWETMREFIEDLPHAEELIIGR